MVSRPLLDMRWYKRTVIVHQIGELFFDLSYLKTDEDVNDPSSISVLHRLIHAVVVRCENSTYFHMGNNTRQPRMAILHQ